MERKRLLRTLYMAVAWLFLLAGVLVTATYAWFTFSAATNVTPMGSTVSKGDAYLLIANNPAGQFDKECTLVLDGTVDVLRPLSTADLSGFYSAKAQNREGISILFADATGLVNRDAIHGKVYLKCENGDCDVYFYKSGLSLGKDIQALAAMRLGLKVTTQSGVQSYIFRLDAMGDTDSAIARRTVSEADTVISSVNDDGSAVFVKDPSESIVYYMATEQGAEDDAPGAGDRALCSLKAEEIATVEYWLYLEGCDEHCINEVQEREIDLQLAFAGVSVQ